MFQAQLGDVSSFLLYNYVHILIMFDNRIIMNMKVIIHKNNAMSDVSAQAQVSVATRLLPMHHNMCITFFMIITCMVFMKCMVIIDHHT